MNILKEYYIGENYIRYAVSDTPVVSVGMLRAGKARNIIPDEAYFMGILRTKGFTNRDMMTQRIIDTIMQVEEETGVYCDVEVLYGYPGVINHDNETAIAEKAAREVLNDENVTVMDEGTMTSEDFGYFLLERPGCFYHIGVESEAGLHSPLFNPKESAIAKAAAVHAAVLWKYLEEHKEK